jgi:hypothetical protein
MSKMPSKEAWTWSRAQWGEVELGDERRQRRAVAVGAALAEASARSLPQQLQSRAATKATYRLMDCEEVTHAALIEPHRQATRQAAQACGPEPVLFVQDGSCLDFTHRNSLEGVGRIGNDRGQGFCLHSCLALEAQSGQVLGLADQRFWARTEPARPESRTQRARRRTEADVWAESLESIGPVPEGATWVSVADRGADVYSHLCRARALGWHCLVRACQDRALADGGHLLQQVRTLAPMSQRTVRVRAGNGRPTDRELQVAWGAVQLPPPQRAAAGRGLPPEPLAVWVIRVWDEGLEWVLLSTLPVEDAQAAAERIDWYGRRWTIEDYHKGLKTGCRIEASQLRTAERFGALLGFAALVAVRLVQLRDRARQAPEAPVAESELSQKVVAARLKVAPEAVATNLGFWRGVAQLGGFLGRKGDGEPGWQSLWRGWQELQLLLQGVELAQALQEKCG